VSTPTMTHQYIRRIETRLTEVTTLLARGVHERDMDEAAPGTALWDARVHLGLDGRTGARDIRNDSTGGGNARRCEDPACRNYGTSLHRTPVVLAVDPGVQVEQEADRA
jgi:hypothetical protein